MEREYKFIRIYKESHDTLVEVSKLVGESYGFKAPMDHIINRILDNDVETTFKRYKKTFKATI